MEQWLSAHSDTLFRVLRHIDTPVSLSQWLLLKNREWDQLATRWVDPMQYPEGVFSALRYRRDAQAVDLFRKAPLDTSFSRRDAALKAWDAAEEKCFMTNEFLTRLLSTRTTAAERDFVEFLRKVKKRLGRWLGPLPDDLVGRFGPGTSFESDVRDPTVMDKIWLTPTTTSAAQDYFSILYGRTHWGISRAAAGLNFIGTCRGNRLTTVPKDGKTDRPICIEPLGNLWLQLGIGSYLKKRLRLVGLPRFADSVKEILPGLTVSYPDAQSIHRRLAQDGRRLGLCTIDLSSASDTIARELVRWVLPDDWFAVLDDFRSPMTLVPSKDGPRWRLLEKFSSMGNGFTFELETFIFLALLCERFSLQPGRDCWVFGDDIIIPQSHGADACNLLSVCGFSPNRRKSYLSGPFRESCGGHFHSDIDVNSVRLQDDPEELPEVIALHNNLLRWGIPFPILKGLREAVPSRYRVFGPSWLGDVVLHGRPGLIRHRDGCAWVRVLKFRSADFIDRDRWSPELHLTSVLLGVPDRIVRRHCRVVPTLSWASVS